MSAKRHRSLVDYYDDDDDDDVQDTVQSAHTSRPPSKRPRTTGASHIQHAVSSSSADRISRLSDELLLRILSFLSLPSLLTAAPVSHRFARLAADSQLWKAHYYERFVLPRAMRIPGFRESRGSGRWGEGDHKLHYSGRRRLWADGRRGGLVREAARGSSVLAHVPDEGERVDWRKQYKLRHNWSRGKCAVEELKIGLDAHASEEAEGGRMLVKVIEGAAITVDAKSGLRAWDLKTKDLLAQVELGDDGTAAPTCVAVDDHHFHHKSLDIAVGFVDGSFGVWKLDLQAARFDQRYWHQKSSNGELIGMAYSHPYLLTATESVLVSLYTFNGPSKSDGDGLDEDTKNGTKDLKTTNDDAPKERGVKGLAQPTSSGIHDQHGRGKLRPAYLLTSLRSHTSRPPLALSIRRTAATTIASIAYTFSTRQGWSIGIQDLHIRAPSTKLGATPEVTTTRLAYTPPITSGRPSIPSSSPPSTPPRRSGTTRDVESSPAAPPRTSAMADEPGPTSLCYTHPYLLATLPDNTLILHLCTSNASTLSVSPGIRLWGHTSGISDAEITARGKAVSVSSRGDEMRVWELEGRPSAAFSSRSVEIRPSAASGGDVDGEGTTPPPFPQSRSQPQGEGSDWDERRNWVGFDDEMVIVLKESKQGRESLLVYDFT